jgi:hypothetical protein
MYKGIVAVKHCRERWHAVQTNTLKLGVAESTATEVSRGNSFNACMSTERGQ